jgi:hypothetical protein
MHNERKIEQGIKAQRKNCEVPSLSPSTALTAKDVPSIRGKMIALKDLATILCEFLYLKSCGIQIQNIELGKASHFENVTTSRKFDNGRVTDND